MPTYRYNGLKEGFAEKYLAEQLKYYQNGYAPDPVWGGFPWNNDGNPQRYYINSKDPPAVVDRKKALQAEWVAMREAECKEHLAKLDACYTIWGVDFPKGEVVEVPATHKLALPSVRNRKRYPPKLVALASEGVLEELGGKEEATTEGKPTRSKLNTLKKADLLEMAEAMGLDFADDDPNKATLVEGILAKLESGE